MNLINTYNEQIGEAFRVIPKPYDYAVWDRGPYVPIDNNYILNPPVGFKNGYIAYLDSETRSEYWTGYATIVWNNRADIREEFSHNFNKYLIYFNTQLKITQQTAREEAKSIQYDLSTLNIVLSSTAVNASDPLLSQRSTITIGTNKFTLFSKNSDPQNKTQHTCIVI